MMMMMMISEIITNIYKKCEITENTQLTQKVQTLRPNKLFCKLDSRIGIERSKTEA
jgi:hypothetical protein